MDIRVYGTPDQMRGEDLTEVTAVIIDALRMTSVATVAIANGCTGLMAVGEVDTAREIAVKHDALLGGEREALQIEGFDFSNSPLEYSPERIGGHRLVMTTSNGTRAILAAEGAKRRLLGAFLNARAVARAVAGEAHVAIVCAGTLGAFTLEDAMAAGAIIERLADGRVSLQLNDMAIAAQMLYAGAKDNLHAPLSKTKHYNRLLSLGMQADLDFCLQEDVLNAVPECGPDGWFR